MAGTPRLVIVSGSFPDIVCGISPYAERIARMIADQGDFDVHVLTSSDSAVNASIAKNYQVHPDVDDWRFFRAGQICRHILKLNPDVVYIQNPCIKYRGINALTMSQVVGKLKKLAGHIRVVVTQHDIAISRPILRRRYRKLFNSSDGILVSNNRDQQAVADQGIAPSKIHKARFSSFIKLHPVSEEARAVGRMSLGIPQEAQCILFFGFVLPGRNVDVLLRAVKILHENRPNIHLLVLGGPNKQSPDYYKQCRDLATGLGLDSSTTWTGFASEDQIADGMAAADLFACLLQRGADLRNTSIITGLLAQLPVVTSENPRYYRDTQIKEYGCLCVDPNDPSAVAKAMATCLDNPPDTIKRQQVAEELQPDKVWAEHLEIVLAALNPSRHT